MKIREIIERITAYHPDLGERLATTRDTVKTGNIDVECTGVATTIYASVGVIREAVKCGCNLIIVHEPTFYEDMDTRDGLESIAVAQQKLKLLEDNGIVIFRDHDRIHSHKPDGIFYGLTTELGWQPFLQRNSAATGGQLRYMWRFPEPIPFETIARLFIDKLQLNNAQFIGNRQAQISSAMLGTHFFPGSRSYLAAFEASGCDLLIPGETIDWELNEYFKDAGQLGLNRVMLRLGHFNMEELGMKYMVGWLSELLDNAVPVMFACNRDMYQYIN